MSEKEDLKQALKKTADYLSRRSLSEKELRVKLSKKFSLEIVNQALEKAKQKQWLELEEALSQRTVDSLHEKNKSWSYIKGYLIAKGLPLPLYNREKELLKARNLLVKKRGHLKNLSFKEKSQLRRFLSYRGFEGFIADELLN